VVGGSTWAATKVVQPSLVLSNNTPTGGDMGAHVMGPAFLRDELLANGQLSGWSNYWYSGLPMYRFYMVIPALMIVALNVVLPYGIAFKIVVVCGIITLPLCCFAFGRLARFRYPMPELFALGGLLFLFDESFSIYGGNVKSTMAGEFSFSIALSLGILGLGLLARGLETGKYRSWAAIVLALACLSHGIVLIFVALGAILLCLVWVDRTRLWYSVTTGVTVVLLSAFWVLPFLLNHASMTDMKYGYRPQGADDSFWDMFFPLTTFFDIFITGFAIVGFVASIVRRSCWTPTWKTRSLRHRRTMSSSSWKSRAGDSAAPSSAAQAAASGGARLKLSARTRSSSAARVLSWSARRGAPPMISATKPRRCGFAWNSEKICTPAGSRDMKRSKLRKAACGSGVRPSAPSSAGISSVNNSRARPLRMQR
jgi:hypothetical protein